jgi:murein DD-endopeptidase MepM/ murein hydrolase activator NlpD
MHPRMTKKLLYLLVVAALATIAVVSFALPAGAEQRTFRVKLSDGSVITVTVDAACGAIPSLPGHVVSEVPGACSTPALPTQPSAPAPPTTIVTPPSGGGNGGSNGNNSSSGSNGSSGSSGSSSSNGSKSNGGSSGTSTGNSSTNPQGTGQATGQGTGSSTSTKKHPAANAAPPTHHSNGVPTSTNPTFFNALPGPAQINGVPNFVIQKFKVPIFLLPIYQAAGIQYGIRWEVLAGINEIETDYGRNLNVSSAGALGWMQFMPATWKTYGTDANDDGKRDPYNPVDAIFAAARYLKAAGGDKDIRKAVFAYNHAGWYVDSVMLRARLIAGYPPDFVGSLTGLTEGRFPVAARAKYADDAAARAAQARIKAGQNASRVISSSANRRGIDIFSKKGAAVIATNDGVVKKVGVSKADGRYLVLQDVYGNQYTYSHLGSVQRLYPVPKQDAKPTGRAAQIISARQHANDPKPKLAASAGSHSLSSSTAPSKNAKVPKGQRAPAKSATQPAPAEPTVTYKARLFAHPQRPGARHAGGLDQVFDTQLHGNGSKFTTYDNYFSGKVGLNAKNSKLQPLKKGSKVIAGTVIGRIGKTDAAKAPHLYFAIRPAGKGAPQIDPKPILDGWKLLESTAIYRANGKNALYGGSSAFSIGQVLLMPKALLQKRVLSDPRVQIYPAGRNDIKTGQIDRRVLATLEYLAESGLNPTVTSLKSGHSDRTTSGNISEHSTGDAADIAKVNGVPILGHQDKGGVAEQTVRRLMLLQGTMAPHQIISLLNFGANTLSMADHNDHVHVGFRPLFGDNAKLGAQTAAILKPGQWDNLVHRLNTLPNPVVPTKPSKYALPAKAGSKNGD